MNGNNTKTTYTIAKLVCSHCSGRWWYFRKQVNSAHTWGRSWRITAGCDRWKLC